MKSRSETLDRFVKAFLFLKIMTRLQKCELEMQKGISYNENNHERNLHFKKMD